jgi:hypothetical protein
VSAEPIRRLSAASIRRLIAEMLRTQSQVVQSYLDYAKRYADLIHNHASAAALERWPTETTSGLRLIAVLRCQSETPEVLEQKLDALKKSKAKVTLVVPCQDTLALYLFGPHE